MRIEEAQDEIRTRYIGGFYGQLVGGAGIAMVGSDHFSLGVWFTRVVLLVFAGVGKIIADPSWRTTTANHPFGTDAIRGHQE